MDTRTLHGSPDRFGYQWDRYAEILPESRGQLERWLAPHTLADLSGKTVLDVGCGNGRNPHWMARAGARRIVAVDVDERSLAAARANLAPFPHAEVMQCSAYDLDPEEVGTFDFVTCIGVLHHLAEPERALKRIWACVAPGGTLVVWVYAREGNRLFLPAIQALRWTGSRLPLAVMHTVASVMSLAVWPAARLLPFRTQYYRNLARLSFRNLRLIIFDQMIPRISHYWTRDEVLVLARPLGGTVELTHVQGNSWNLTVRKD